jgi:hypothetical protein
VNAAPPPPPSKYAIKIVHPNGQEVTLFDPLPKQREFLAAPQPNVAYIGARGAGKSLCARYMAHAMALQHPGFTYVILRRTFPELQRSHLLFLESETKQLGATYHRTLNQVTYPTGSVGLFAHCAEDRDVLNLLSAQFGLMLVDEGSTFPWDMLLSLKTSVRVPVGAGYPALFRLVTNPFGPSAGEIWRHFVTKDVDDNPDYDPLDWHAVRTVMSDNPHISEREYRKQFQGLPAHQRAAWLEGTYIDERALFTLKPTITVDTPTADGTLAPERREFHVIDELPTFDGKSILEAPWVRHFRFYDAGFIEPAYCGWAAVFGKRIIVWKEKLWTRTPADEIARDILRESVITGSDGRPFPLPVTATYCDPSIHLKTSAVESVLETMERQHITVAGQRMSLVMEPAVNNRTLFADVLHRVLGEEVEPNTPRIQFLADGCPYLIRTIPQMAYDPKDPQRLADHKHDHGVCALAYLLMSHLPTTKPSAATRQPWWRKELRLSNRHVLGSSQVRSR